MQDSDKRKTMDNDQKLNPQKNKRAALPSFINKVTP